MQFNNKFTVFNRNILLAELSVSFFWLLYALQSTVLADSELFKFSGIFYPLYLLMLIVAAKNFLKSKKCGEVRQLLVLYYLFLCVVAFSLLVNQSLLLDFATQQLLFIYCLGLLTMFQFSSHSTWNFFRLAIGFSSAVVTVWLILSFFTASTLEVYRGGIEVNANYVATIIAIGAIVVAGDLTKQNPFWRKTLVALFLVAAFYAMSLLASRGVTIAFLVGLAVLYLRSRVRVVTIISLSFIAIIAVVVLPQLPGSEMLFLRLSEGNIQTLNDRTIIWRGCLQALETGSLFQMLFGLGFRASEDIVASTIRGLSSTHNGYLRILIEQGVSGLAVFLAMHALVLRRLWREGEAGKEALALLVTMMVINLSGSITDGFLYWTVFGVVSAIAFGITTAEGSKPGCRNVV